MDYTAADNLELAKSVFGNCDDGSLLPEDADWTEGRFALADLACLMEGGAEGWKSWFHDEVAMLRHDQGGGRVHWEDFAESEIDEPCVIAIGEDGVPDIWDGWHRIAGAFVRGADDMPAVTGRRKPLPEPEPMRP